MSSDSQCSLSCKGAKGRRQTRGSGKLVERLIPEVVVSAGGWRATRWRTALERADPAVAIDVKIEVFHQQILHEFADTRAIF